MPDDSLCAPVVVVELTVAAILAIGAMILGFVKYLQGRQTGNSQNGKD